MAIIRDELQVFETIRILALDLITIAGKRINLIDIFQGLLLYESIFDYFMSGKVYIADTYDFYKNESLSGNEEIQITLQERSTGIQKNYSFRLYKINRDSGVTKASSKSKILECYFFSGEKQIDNINRICRKFSGFPDVIVDTIVKSIYQSPKTLFVDDAESEIDYFCNYHQGSSVINFMTRNAISETGDSDYVFFESMAGFHFVPLSFLLAQTEVENMVYLPKREATFRIDNMDFFQQEAYFDLNLDAERGVFGKTLYKLNDNDRYGIVKTAATYADNAGRFLTNGRNLLFSEDLFNSNNLVTANYHNHQVAQVRSALLTTLLLNNKLIVRTIGTLDRKAGDILKVEYPNLDNIPEPNTSLDGSWIISSIKHTISNGFEYTQNMMLIKNARNFDNNLPISSGEYKI